MKKIISSITLVFALASLLILTSCGKKSAKIKLGMTKKEVLAELGEPSYAEYDKLFYASGSAGKKMKQVDKLLESDSTTDFYKALKLIGELEKMTFKFKLLKFENDKLIEYFYDTNHTYDEDNWYKSSNTKTVKDYNVYPETGLSYYIDNRLDDKTVFCDLEGELYYVTKFSDKSEYMAYVKITDKTVNENDITIKFQDRFQKYECKVKKHCIGEIDRNGYVDSWTGDSKYIPSDIKGYNNGVVIDGDEIEKITKTIDGLTYAGIKIGDKETLTKLIKVDNDVVVANIADTVTEIDKNAFMNCKNLMSLTIPKGVKQLEPYTLPFNIIEIYNYSSVVIKKTGSNGSYWWCYVNSKGEMDSLGTKLLALHKNTNEESIIVKDGDYYFAYKNNKGYIVKYVGNEKNVTVPTSFNYDGRTINVSVLHHGFNGENCKNISSITIPGSINKISGYNTFSGCSELKFLTIDEGVTELDGHAFTGCYKLLEIIFPKSITEYPHNTFFINSDIDTAFFYNGSIEDWCKIKFTENEDGFTNNPILNNFHFYFKDNNGNVYRNGSSYSLATEIVVPNISRIGDYQFMNFKDLLKLTIPSTVNSIGENSFKGCKSLIEIYNLSSVDVSDKCLVVHDSLSEYSTIVTSNDFIFACYQNEGYVCSFSGTTAGDLEIPSSFTYDGSIIDVKYIWDSFYMYDTITLPNTVEKICCDWKFMEHTIYFDGTINEWLTVIKGGSYFVDMVLNVYFIDVDGDIIHNTKRYSSINILTIPNSITSINRNTLFKFDQITSIIISNSVVKIDWLAFKYCTNLSAVYYMGTEEQWNNINISETGNEPIINATKYYYSETQATGCWHYVDGVPTIWS